MKKITLFICAVLVVIVLGNNSYENEIIIPNESIRIRVVANSNSIKDQNLKFRVKKSIQVQLSNLLKDAKNIDDVRDILNKNMDGVKYSVKSTLEKEDAPSTFTVNYGYNFFPKKVFKGVKYSEGIYESIVITLGDAKGDNWWCVLFPPLCLMDGNEEKMDNVQYKSFVKEVIDKYF